MRTKFLVFALLVFTLVACNLPVFSNQPDLPTPPTIPATGFQGETACEPSSEEIGCIMLDFDELVINGNEVVQAHADWVTKNEQLTGNPQAITLMYNVVEENRLEQVVIQPNGQTNMDIACQEVTDCTVYKIVANGYSCESRKGTSVFDCPLN